MQMQMQPRMAAYYHTNITTDHIQQYLDENKSLILKIVESQNSGKLSECAEYIYLYVTWGSILVDGKLVLQYPGGGAQYLQAQQLPPQSLMAARSSMLYGEHPYQSLQQQQNHHGHLGINSCGNNGLMLQGEPFSSGGGSFPDFNRGFLGMKQESVNGMTIDGDNGENLYLKTSE